MKHNRWLGWVIAGAALFLLLTFLYNAIVPDAGFDPRSGMHAGHHVTRFYAEPSVNPAASVAWLALGMAVLLLKVGFFAAIIAAVVFAARKILKTKSNEMVVPRPLTRTYHTGAMLDEWERRQSKEDK